MVGVDLLEPQGLNEIANAAVPCLLMIESLGQRPHASAKSLYFFARPRRRNDAGRHAVAHGQYQGVHGMAGCVVEARGRRNLRDRRRFVLDDLDRGEYGGGEPLILGYLVVVLGPHHERRFSSTPSGDHLLVDDYADPVLKRRLEFLFLLHYHEERAPP
ncbi:MAG: hypothetical protein OXG81_13655 [Acidobacteria bacterium]|nr:hypothetical protein [Acidobacteriota bacterium]